MRPVVSVAIAKRCVAVSGVHRGGRLGRCDTRAADSGLSWSCCAIEAASKFLLVAIPPPVTVVPRIVGA
jgi:hypothetical protein